VDHSILDEGDWCYKKERDKIFPRTRMSMKLVKLWILRCCYYFFLCFGLQNFEDEIFIRREEYSDPNI
jgi:hypothetical protein